MPRGSANAVVAVMSAEQSSSGDEVFSWIRIHVVGDGVGWCRIRVDWRQNAGWVDLRHDANCAAGLQQLATIHYFNLL